MYEYIKRVLPPVMSALFLAALFRPLCMADGTCDYLMLWLCMGIPFGIHRMTLWIIPKGHDIGGTMGILALNLVIGSVIGGTVLMWRMVIAAMYLVKGVVSGSIWITGKLGRGFCRCKWKIR